MLLRNITKKKRIKGNLIKRFLIHGFDPEHPDDEVKAELKDRLREGFVKAHRLNKTNQDKNGPNSINYSSLR